MPLPDQDDYLSTYGGSKINYAPPEDPTTDEDAGIRNQYVANVAMMTLTAVRALALFTPAATTGTMALVSHAANWGNSATVAPVLNRVAAGVYTLTWPATVIDALGLSHTTNFRFVTCNVRGSGTPWIYNAAITSANVVTVWTYSSAGAATDPATTNVDVVVY